MLDHLFREDAIGEVFDGRSTLQCMLDFESALAKVEARYGIIPRSAAEAIAMVCKATAYDRDGIAREARAAGNLAIPMIRALTMKVAGSDIEAARWVHWGATSQDVIDTARILQLRSALDLLSTALDRLIAIVGRRVRAERNTVMAGRTWLQQAVPITFGLKAAGWLDTLLRERQRLRELRPRLLVLQFGGAAGTLASLNGRGVEVAELLAQELQLGLPALPWHAHRDRIVEAGAAVGLLAGTLGKMARDISLLMQTEVGEALEAQGGEGHGSSTMPHKRNPVGCAVALAAALRVPGLVATLYSAMPQEHERGLGNWPAEWETLPEIFVLTAGSLAVMSDVVEGLKLDRGRMRDNLEVASGLVYAEGVSLRLAESLGKQDAHELTARACIRARNERRALREVLAEDATIGKILSEEELDRLFDPSLALGAAPIFIDRVLALAEV